MQLEGDVTKDPFDEFPIDVDFAKRQPTGAPAMSLVSVTATKLSDGSDASAALVKTTPPPTVIGTVLVVWLQGGVPNEDYMLTMRVSFATAPVPVKWESTLPVRVRDE